MDAVSARPGHALVTHAVCRAPTTGQFDREVVTGWSAKAKPIGFPQVVSYVVVLNGLPTRYVRACDAVSIMEFYDDVFHSANAVERFAGPA